MPRLAGRLAAGSFRTLGPAGLAVDWTLGDGARLHLRANWSEAPAPQVQPGPGVLLHSEGGLGPGRALPPWGGVWTLEGA